MDTTTRTQELKAFCKQLDLEEKAEATKEKYHREILQFLQYIGEAPLCKEVVIAYKQWLLSRYAVASVCAKLVAVHRFLQFINHRDCCVKLPKYQRNPFYGENRCLQKKEYLQLLQASVGTSLYYVLFTLYTTGIRISELQYITVEAIRQGKVVVQCKNKYRVILFSKATQKMLLQYSKEYHRTQGMLFVTRHGNCIDRSNLWRQLKQLAEKAGVEKSKVFPHNFRHLFAREFYKAEKDLVLLADLLGHSSVDTTRIYTIQTESTCRERLDRWQMLLYP